MIPENVLRNIPPTLGEWIESHIVDDDEESMRLSEAALKFKANPVYRRIVGALEARTVQSLANADTEEQNRLLLMLQALRLLRQEVKALAMKAEQEKLEQSKPS